MTPAVSFALIVLATCTCFGLLAMLTDDALLLLLRPVAAIYRWWQSLPCLGDTDGGAR